jgi:imidazolonepropionase-like amidohydrolase
MAEHGAAGSTFSDWWQYKLEAYDAIPHNAAIMQEHGVLTSLNSDIPWLQSFMVYEFNKPVKYGGVGREQALQMLTLNPARQLLIDDKVGSIEVGKQADLVLLSGDPFDVYTRVEQTIVDGIVYYDLEQEEATRRLPVRPLPPARLVPDISSQPADMRTVVHTVAFSGEAAAASQGLTAGPAQGPVTALVGATVHPVSGPAIPNGTVLIADGRIRAVGTATGVSVPAGAQVLDLRGKHVYPGMIDAVTQLGMVEIGSVASARDDREVGRYNPHLNAEFSVHPHSEAIPVARANGITAAYTNLGAAGGTIIPGTGSLIQLDGDTQARMTLVDRAALLLNLPSATGKAWEEPSLKGQRLEEVVQLFERATLYARQPSSRFDATQRFEANLANRESIMLEALVPAVTGAMPVYVTARRERDIKTLFLLLDEFPDVRAVVVGGDQAFRVANELASRNIPVIITSALSPTMDRDDPVSAGWRNASMLHAAGVTVAFGTSDVANVRNLPYHAAKSAAFGLPKDVALRAVTLTPAEILGVDDQMGSIEVGKRADLIITNGDPLQIVTQVEGMFIAGREVSLDSRHTRLWEKFRNRH